MGISKGQEINYKNLNDAFISAIGDGTISGNLEVGSALEVRGYNTNSEGADLFFFADGLISAEDSMIFMIDNDNDSSSVDFIWKRDTDVHPGGTTLMTLAEEGQLYIHYTGDADLSNPGGLVIGEVSGYNVTLDADEILARNNGATSALYLQRSGGTAVVGNDLLVLNSTGQIQSNFTSDADLSTDGAITIGLASSNNVTFDNDEIMARNNGAAASLYLNRNGSTVVIGNDAIILNSNGALSTTGNIATGNGDQNNSVELSDGAIAIYHATPTINFHFGNGGGVDANLQNSASGVLETSGSFKVSGTTKAAGVFYAGSSDPTNSDRLNYDGYFYATRVYNAVYNDLAEFMHYNDNFSVKAGQVMIQGTISLMPSQKRADPKVIGVYSDTYGFALGADTSDPEAIPIGLAGKVKVFIEGSVEPGDELVSAKDGRAIKANLIERLFKRQCIIGKALEQGINSRIWMLIK